MKPTEEKKMVTPFAKFATIAFAATVLVAGAGGDGDGVEVRDDPRVRIGASEGEVQNEAFIWCRSSRIHVADRA